MVDPGGQVRSEDSPSLTSNVGGHNRNQDTSEALSVQRLEVAVQGSVPYNAIMGKKTPRRGGHSKEGKSIEGRLVVIPRPPEMGVSPNYRRMR